MSSTSTRRRRPWAAASAGARPTDGGRARRLGDAGRDRGVDRRDELGAAREVDLVAVVARRVVAGGDREARGRAEVRDGEGEQGRRDGVGEEAHGDAEAVQHGRRVLGEAPARVAAVEGDHDPARARVGAPARRLVEEVRPEAPGGLHDREAVHARKPRLDPAAQARRPELERARHAVGQVPPRRLVSGLGAAHEGLELGAGLGVGVLGQERAGGGEGVAHAVHSTAGLRSGMLATALLPAFLASTPVDPALAERFARLALACVHQEYPNKIAHVMSSDADARPPRELTPAFYGCYDWHSSVHGHWLLARARAAPSRGAVRRRRARGPRPQPDGRQSRGRGALPRGEGPRELRAAVRPRLAAAARARSCGSGARPRRASGRRRSRRSSGRRRHACATGCRS